MAFNPEDLQVTIKSLKHQLFDAERTGDSSEAASLEDEIAELERQISESPFKADESTKPDDIEDMMNILPESPYPPEEQIIPPLSSKEIAREELEKIRKILEGG